MDRVRQNSAEARLNKAAGAQLLEERAWSQSASALRSGNRRELGEIGGRQPERSAAIEITGIRTGSRRSTAWA